MLFQSHWPFPSEHIMEASFHIFMPFGFVLCLYFQLHFYVWHHVIIRLYHLWLVQLRFSLFQGYAYILTHPGIPTVLYDHFYDWGDSIRDQIAKLVIPLFCFSFLMKTSICRFLNLCFHEDGNQKKPRYTQPFNHKNYRGSTKFVFCNNRR